MSFLNSIKCLSYKETIEAIHTVFIIKNTDIVELTLALLMLYTNLKSY